MKGRTPVVGYAPLEMYQKLRLAAEEVRQAIENAGPHPRYHEEVMRTHREEWPTLHRAIMRLIEVLKDE